LGNPAVIGIGAPKVPLIGWSWTRLATFKKEQVGWAAIPTTAGDCAGFNPGKLAAGTFSCTSNQRYMCEPA